jgi:hypothetical protein
MLTFELIDGAQGWNWGITNFAVKFIDNDILISWGNDIPGNPIHYRRIETEK